MARIKVKGSKVGEEVIFDKDAKVVHIYRADLGRVVQSFARDGEKIWESMLRKARQRGDIIEP